MSKYIGSRIVPKHCGNWSAAKSYDVLSVVLYAATGDSYIARKAVPTDVDITDTDYWAKAADFSAQLETISNKVAALQTTADKLASQIAENVSASTDADADYAAEVVDARTDGNGETYTSLGEAIRGQATALSEEINDAAEQAALQRVLIDASTYNLDTNAYIDRSTGEEVALTNNRYWSSNYIEIPESAIGIVLFHASASGFASIFFYDADQAYLGYDGYYTTNQLAGETFSYDVPDGAAYFRFTHYANSSFEGEPKVWYQNCDAATLKVLKAQVEKNTAAISALNEETIPGLEDADAEILAQLQALADEWEAQEFEIDSSLYDLDTNCYIDKSTGEEAAAGNSKYRCSGFIKIPESAVKITLYYASAANFASIFFYDEDQAYLGYDGLYTSNQLYGEKISFDIPDGAAYFKFTHFGNIVSNSEVKVWYNNITFAEIKALVSKVGANSNAIAENAEQILELSETVETLSEVGANHWNGKTANFLGDSITYGAYTPVGGSSPNQRADKRYCDIAGELLGMEVNNYAQSGISISSTSTQSPTSAMSLRYSIMSDDADLIVIMGGTNDFGTGVALGSSSDTTDVSFYGGLYVLCNGLTEKYLGKRIVFITPILRSNEGSTNSDGHTLEEYRQAIYDVARDKFGFAVIDGKSLGLSPMNSTMKASYIVDGLHPNPIGHEVIGTNLAHILKAI